MSVPKDINFFSVIKSESNLSFLANILPYLCNIYLRMFHFTCTHVRT